ncbi:MAG: TetR/AcrR family transcriptional regulator [Pseudomonadota bacterium]
MAGRKGVPKGDKRQRTRRAVVEAAAALIAEKGFDRTSLDEVAARAGMTRGAIHGNFASREDLLLEVVESQLVPIEAEFEPGAPLRVQMRILGEAVAAQARRRRPMAAASASFLLYLLTHEDLRAKVAAQTAETCRQMARGFAQILPADQLPMPVEQFARVVDAMITALVFAHFQAPEVFGEADIVAAFEALAGPAPQAAAGSWARRAW